MECKGATFLGTPEADLGTVRFAFCYSSRTIAIDAGDARRERRSWAITYVDPKTV